MKTKIVTDGNALQGEVIIIGYFENGGKIIDGTTYMLRKHTVKCRKFYIDQMG